MSACGLLWLLETQTLCLRVFGLFRVAFDVEGCYCRLFYLGIYFAVWAG